MRVNATGCRPAEGVSRTTRGKKHKHDEQASGLVSFRSTRLRFVLVLVLMCVLAFVRSIQSAERIDTYPSGGKRAVYTLDDAGRYDGPFQRFHPNGRSHIAGSYRNGQIHGAYVERDASGGLIHAASFADGKLHGVHQQYVGRTQIRDEVWLHGMLIAPKSAAQIRARLDEISKLPVRTVGKVPAAGAFVKAVVNDADRQKDRERAVRRIMTYRYLCDLPYEDIVLDRSYVAHVVAACQMLRKVGKLDHKPENPGMPEAEYKFALKGTSSSNLHRSTRLSVPKSIDAYMFDSDKTNIARLGHRRWCLNPSMQKTGIGAAGNFTAMWSFDRSRPKVPNYEYVAFPPRGLMPAKLVKNEQAWNVSLNPKKFAKPKKDAVKVKVYPAQLSFRGPSLEKDSTPLKLAFFEVNLMGFGIPNCIIFRPEGVKTSSGSAYWVAITGLKTTAGKTASVEYLVAFF
jgi:hypothetical protein